MIGRLLALAVVGVLVLLSFSLVVPIGGSQPPDAAAFGDTFELGLTDTTVREAEERGYAIPRVQVYYSGYQYVVGFNGLEAFVAEQDRTGHSRQFGRPVEIFVTDFGNANPSLTDDGFLQTEDTPNFVSATGTHVVVDSEARLPSGPVAVPFDDRDAAEQFADQYGGRVIDWEDLPDHVSPQQALTRERFQRDVRERSAWANASSRDAEQLRDRPTSIVVGEDVPTLEAAVGAAPSNTTIELPAGTYETDGLVVNRSVTIEGQGAATQLHGDGNGSVLAFTAPRTGLVNLSIDGVGPVGSRGTTVNGSEPEDIGWSERIELAYGRGDAAVKLVDANGSLVADVRIESPSSGVIVTDSAGATLRGLNVTITRGVDDGFMGVVGMYDPIVVEDSRFRGGRDGVYTHRADGIVVRDSEFRDGRFGVHEMYTSNALVTNNTARNVQIGVIVMTHPVGNLIVGNDVRSSRVGISTAGSNAYYAENVLVDNERGIDVLGYQSLIERNTIVRNGAGFRTSLGPPTNLVTANDVVANEQASSSSQGVLRVWTVRGAGNFWGPMPSADDDGDGHYDRTFRPTGSVDGQIHDANGAWTLARSPAFQLVRSVQDNVPGLRSGGVVDTAPRTAPARPDVLAAALNRTATTEGST
ncbi:copper-binding protein [Salinarchaeum sp. Harcht-Bsk1]|uniref:NosD domain-containing protein n=1 Tax=Salinarchaeum sp. Harcht-Bsk1 TaxID=1333523 RepID=UPI00034248E3|nr:NosD domain-containing protein [Salinarchaeum sp. Harcht-Bsk1]AGN00689.1 copper-binding protein [Salinarchaeum sp. Harcht-Bsk1]